jgi:drug/metabolite transporter (DMT)-like permease
LGTAATTTLVINTTAASASTLHNPPKQLSVFYSSSITIAVLFLFRPSIRRKWQTLLQLLIFAIVFGTAIGCGSTGNSVIEPTRFGTVNLGTIAGDYIVAVTGTSDSITVTTAVPVTVK